MAKVSENFREWLGVALRCEGKEFRQMERRKERECYDQECLCRDI